MPVQALLPVPLLVGRVLFMVDAAPHSSGNMLSALLPALLPAVEDNVSHFLDQNPLIFPTVLFLSLGQSSLIEHTSELYIPARRRLAVLEMVAAASPGMPGNCQGKGSSLIDGTGRKLELRSSPSAGWHQISWPPLR